jgi:hypothetical protein
LEETMKIKLLLCLLAGFASANAANYVGNQMFSAPFQLNEPVNIVGNLTFATPGTYSASSWNVVGVVRFAAPGDYFILATEGGLSAASNVLGPDSGKAIVHVSYRGAVNVTGSLPANVLMIDDAQTSLPPPSSPQTPSASSSVPLMNLAVRANLPPGGTIIPAFVIGGTTPRRVVVRAIGPGLAPFGVTNAISNPTLTVFNGSLAVGSNDDWGGSQALAGVFANVGAFGLPAGSRDAALVLTLQPGAYTVSARGGTVGDSGELLVEVYLVE